MSDVTISNLNFKLLNLLNVHTNMPVSNRPIELLYKAQNQFVADFLRGSGSQSIMFCHFQFHSAQIDREIVMVMHNNDTTGAANINSK